MEKRRRKKKIINRQLNAMSNVNKITDNKISSQ